MKLGEIAEQLSCVLEGDADIDISGVATLETALEGDLSFLTNPKYQSEAKRTRASAVITGLDWPAIGRPLLRNRNPYLSVARALELFHSPAASSSGVHPTAWIDESAVIGKDVSIGAFTFVGAHAVIGNGVHIAARCVIEADSNIGGGSVLHAGCIIRHQVVIGARCTVHDNAVVGSDGFGYARTDEGEWYPIPQTGTVVLEDDVSIGAGSTVDRATLGETRIRRGTKLDNLVHVGHGCQIGPDNLICAQVGLAGSTRTGTNVILAGQVGAAGHLEIGDGVIATAQAGIPGSIEPGRHVSGSPAVDHKIWLRFSAAYSRLPHLTRSVRELEDRISTLERQQQER
jgi:UDP-3-O-[3-hydroxymyristoyl] glucosamine N-acyltransferase